MAKSTVFLSCLALATASVLVTAEITSEPLSADQWDEAFKQWLVEHDRDYATDTSTYNYRLKIYQDNAGSLAALKSSHPEAEFELNEFADHTLSEFQKKLGYKPDKLGATPNKLTSFRYEHTEAKFEVDWTTLGKVTGVKNQGQCGSCWAFSTIGSIEGINAIKTGKLVSLSEQELVDCDKKEDMGCGGGLMDNAFEYIIANKGVDTEEDYSYWGLYSYCNQRKEADRDVVEISGYEDVPANEDALAKAVSQQPISVAICADQSLMLYKGGILSDSCTGLNHGVLLVGYGVESDTAVPYWKVKNSWGPAWGEKGYFRLKKDVGGPGTCGITMSASYPVKDDTTNPPAPTICDPQFLSLFECPVKTTCECSFNLFGLLCISYDCVPEASVPCVGHDSWYCDSDVPVCDHANRQCTTQDGLYSKPLMEKTTATKRKGGAQVNDIHAPALRSMTS